MVLAQLEDVRNAQLYNVVKLVQCPLVALKDALCIRRAAIDAVLQIQLSEIEQHDNWLAILANEAKQKRLLLVQPRI